MIYLIITSSIHNRFTSEPDGHRNHLYIHSIRKTLELLPSSIKPIIVENNGKRATYLDDIGVPVYYTNNNSISSKHKGVNELEDIKCVIKAFNIQDDDMIIKLTGRYHPIDDTFFNLVMSNHERDAFVSFFNVCTRVYMDYDCVLGMIALRCRLLKEFTYSCKRSPEVEIATYIKSLPDHTYVAVDKLGLRCCFADDLRWLDV